MSAEVTKLHVKPKDLKPGMQLLRDLYGGSGVTPARSSAAITLGPELPTIKKATQALVDDALQRTSGHQSNAAKALGISPKALNKRQKAN